MCNNRTTHLLSLVLGISCRLEAIIQLPMNFNFLIGKDNDLINRLVHLFQKFFIRQPQQGTCFLQILILLFGPLLFGK